MDTIEAIEGRRSIREFTDEEIAGDLLGRLIEAARWAPSGLNNQPWRFMKIKVGTGLAEALSDLTKYRGIVAGAGALIAVFLDNREMYDRTRDLMSAGAAIQNILLAAHEMGIGTCWLGEILNKREEVEVLLRVPDDYELVAVIAVGYPGKRDRVGVRKPFETFIIDPPEKT